MNRDDMIAKIDHFPKDWDVIIIGGGATGLGAAVDSASRGFRTLLLEQGDFAKGTSSRSTKLIHGGLRYLQQGNIALVTEALRERGILSKNAPHLIHHIPFLVPIYHWWEGPFYGAGLKIYDMLAGKLGIKPSKRLSRRQTLKKIPALEPKGLRGGIIYYDGQFDDSRLAIALAQTAVDRGAIVINYMKVTHLIKKKGICTGVKAIDEETGKPYKLYGKAIINAAGVFSDAIRKMDDERERNMISASRGIHIVLDKSFQPSQNAILVPHTEDKRVIFIVPWHDRILVGTTDTHVKKTTLEPRPSNKEINFLLKCVAQYLVKDPKKEDILSVFAGLRPLIKNKHKKNTAALSRDHTILISKSGLITVTGGKWTIYRKMGEDAIDKAILVAGLPDRPCVTKKLRLHELDSDIKQTQSGQLLHPRLPYSKEDVLQGVKLEMARTVEDILARRTRALLLDARASMEIAPEVAKMMAKELGRDIKWQKKQITAYLRLAKGYVIK